MNMYDFNRFAGAFLATILVVLALGFGGELLVDADEIEGNAYGEIEVAARAPVESEEPAVVPLGVRLAQGNADEGARLVRKCVACHTFEKGGADRIGPNLWSILGAPRGKVHGYNYSGALEDAGGDWGYAELDAFLESPKTAIPGTKMTFNGVKDADERAEIILFLRGNSDSLLPLPQN